MKAPKVGAFLGFCTELTIQQGDHIYEYTFHSAKDAKILVGAASGKGLILVPQKSKLKKPTTEQVSKFKAQIQKAVYVYERFMDFQAKAVAIVDYPTVKLKQFGKAISIVYASDKWEGRENLYIHEFSKRNAPAVYVNAGSKGIDPSVIVIKGGNLAIKKGGISG